MTSSPSLPTRPTTEVHVTRALGFVVGAAVILRAAFAIGTWLVTRDPDVFYTIDTSSYLVPARELLTHGTFTMPNGQPDLLRTPGYPLFLLPGIWFGHPVVTTIATQIALSAATVAGVFVLSRQLFADSRVALAAAALYALEPLSVMYCSILMSETLFATIVVWALVLLVDSVAHDRRGTLVAGTALLAASAYVRPVSYFLPLLVLAPIGGYAAVTRRPRLLAAAGVAAGVAIVIIGPWLARNRALGFRGMSAISAKNLYFYDAGAIRAARSGTPFETTLVAMGFKSDSDYFRLHPEQRAWPPGERWQFMADEGSREIKDNLGLYARMQVSGMARVLFDPGTIDLLKFYHRYPTRHGGLLNTALTLGLRPALTRLFQTNTIAFVLLVAMAAALCVVYGLALRGLIMTRAFKSASVILLLVVASYFVVVAGGPTGGGRFRHPVMPIICALAGAGLRARHGPGRGRSGHRRCRTARRRCAWRQRVEIHLGFLRACSRHFAYEPH